MILIWASIAAGLILLELVTETLVSMWFAIGCLTAMGAAALETPLWVQLLVFIVVSAVSIFFVKPFITKKLSFHPKETHDMIGKCLTVAEPVKDGEGIGLAGDVTWRIKSKDEIPKGKTVIVTKVEGTTLYVKERNVSNG